MSSQRIKATLVASAILTGAAAPEGFAQAGPKDNVLATLQLKDGGIVQFNEPAPGELVALTEIPVGIGKTKGPNAINGIKLQDLGRLDAVNQYKALANGAEVPAALVQAQQRVARAQRAGVAAALKVGAAFKAPAKASTSSKTANARSMASWFQENHCPTRGYSFNHCLLNRTGGGYFTHDASYIKSVIYAEQGNVSHKLQYKDCPFLQPCVWRTSISRTVLQGFWSSISQSGSRMGRRATVYEGSGDLYHWAVYGN